MARKFKIGPERYALLAYEDAARHAMNMARTAFEARYDGLSENQCNLVDASCRAAKASADAAYKNHLRAVKRTSTRNLR